MRNEIRQYGTVIRQNKVYSYQDKVYKIHRMNNRYGENEYFIAQQIQQSKYTKYFVKYHQLIEEDDHYILEMERCQGDLNNLYDSFLSKISPENREYYIFQILKEVLKIYKCFSKLFSKKFIFRDLTLNNILYDSGRIKLCDFEMVRWINENGETLTRNFNQRHDYYLEDEQNEQYDESIDIHSLGVCLYKLYRGPYEVIVYEDGRMKLPLGVKPSLRLQELFDSMLAINPQQRVPWDQLFKYIYKETIRVRDITQTFEFYHCQQFNYFDFRFIIQQLIYRDEAFNVTASQTRQFQTINLFMDEFCTKVNKIFLDIVENTNFDQDALLFLHFRMMTFRIQQLQIQAEKFDDEIDRFDIIEQLNEPIYLFQMFAQLIAYLEKDTIEKLIKNEDKMIQDYYMSHKGEQAEYFHFLEIMKQLYT